ncbi:type II secretion system minor pseudopilin GspK [Colwellia sp. Bg11-28]|uniref:type II secretion system minor pseudopilin GspK n=1 Tax=Colwellia sp. Bg11-28 TaxID=2058305 RepID=UPI000C328AB3|nr:type II secretion system minor pseudopilin GspK [Colwellia sp. Bg11-28]PKH85712.1 general secretion pathway protein GspK [Colwellia sp. Bg11-28]
MVIKQVSTSYNKSGQRGVALITVMLIVALASIIAAQMTARLQTQMQRSTNISFNQQAYWYALGAEAFTKRVLIKAFKDEPDVTHLEQIWAEEGSNYPVDFGEISGEISDLQSCLNLNALHPEAKTKAEAKSGTGSSSNSPAAKNKTKSATASSTGSRSNSASNKQLPAATVLEALIVNLNIEGIGNFEAEAMVNALTDWLDSNDIITGSGGAEDNDYASREFPYLAANSYLASVNELRLIEHFTPAVILALTPYVCVLPQNPQHLININTLDAEKPELLQALLGSSLEDAQEVLSARDSSGYGDVADFLKLKELTKIRLEKWQTASFVIDSEYFKLKASARFNNSYFSMSSMMKVNDTQQIQVISRTIGRN